MNLDDVPADFKTFCKMANMGDIKILEAWQAIWKKTIESEAFKTTLAQNLQSFYTAIRNTLPVDLQTKIDEYFK